MPATDMTIVADDYGIGPETSRGILDLAMAGKISATVMIVNCVDAERAVAEWKRHAPAVDLGWHPNLTLDQPVAPAATVPSLVQPNGQFWPLGKFLQRVLTRRIAYDDVVREWTAQLVRFRQLVGQYPPVVNSHQHVSLFSPCSRALQTVLTTAGIRPYVRRVVESARLIRRIPGARFKRTVLTILGRRGARQFGTAGFIGCDRLIGVTDPPCVTDELFWVRWIQAIDRTFTLEICCHPGYRDDSLVGRDCDAHDGLERRPRETALIAAPSFEKAWKDSGFRLVRPSQMVLARTHTDL